MEPEFIGYPPQPDEEEHNALIMQWRNGIRVWTKEYREQSAMQVRCSSDIAFCFFLRNYISSNSILNCFHVHDLTI